MRERGRSGKRRVGRRGAELHQAHELAIGWLCSHVETSEKYAGIVVVTEREMRSRERERRTLDEPPRYRLDLETAPQGQRSRWPDLVLERGGQLGWGPGS